MIMTDLPPVGVEKFLEQESARVCTTRRRFGSGRLDQRTVHPVRTRSAHSGC